MQHEVLRAAGVALRWSRVTTSFEYGVAVEAWLLQTEQLLDFEERRLVYEAAHFVTEHLGGQHVGSRNKEAPGWPSRGFAFGVVWPQRTVTELAVRALCTTNTVKKQSLARVCLPGASALRACPGVEAAL